MHDAVQFELHGKPAVAVIEDVFEPLAEAKKELMGLPDFEAIIIEHPIGNPEDAAVKGAEIVKQAIQWLTRGSLT
jgi:hypothetical protein